jgi:hypothetical protein
MTVLRRLRFAAFALAAGVVAFAGAHAQPPAAKKQAAKQQLKLQREQQQKAEEARKREEERAKQEKLKVELAKKETGTRPDRLIPKSLGDATAVSSEIDRQVSAKLSTEKAPAGEISSDAEFLRRVSLDLTGQIPAPSRAREFLESREPDKRARLVDELLASPNFGRHQADLWMSVLVTRTSDQRRITFEPLRDWLKDQFNANRPWSRIAGELIASTGEQDKNPAVTFYLSNNTVDKMTDTVSRVFMGVSIQCAQCHDHKFEDWKQTEYWSLAQFFMKVSVTGTGPGMKDAEPGVAEVKSPNRKRFPLPEDAKSVPARYLRDSTSVTLPADNSPVRPLLAQWLTSPSNPYFARAFVNRTWSQFFGVGIVHPVDDMGPNAIASHPAMLDNLSSHFAADGFQVKNLFRGIVLSQTYQRSSKPTGGPGDEDPRLFARMATKIMTPEQLFDSTMSVAIVDGPAAARLKKAAGAPKGGNIDPRERFVNFFLAGQEMASTTEYDVGIPQALKLMNSRQIGTPAAAQAIIGTRKNAEAVQQLYLATLSRLPTSEETTRMLSHVKSAGNPETGYADVLWALLNCSEFTMVR